MDRRTMHGPWIYSFHTRSSPVISSLTPSGATWARRGARNVGFWWLGRQRPLVAFMAFLASMDAMWGIVGSWMGIDVVLRSRDEGEKEMAQTSPSQVDKRRGLCTRLLGARHGCYSHVTRAEQGVITTGFVDANVA